MKWIKDIKRVMDLAGLEEDPSKYIEEFEKVMELFDELDKYGEIIERYQPLYHPLEIETTPRRDSIEYSETYKDLELDEDGYVRGPPIKRK